MCIYGAADGEIPARARGQEMSSPAGAADGEIPARARRTAGATDGGRGRRRGRWRRRGKSRQPDGEDLGFLLAFADGLGEKRRSGYIYAKGL